MRFRFYAIWLCLIYIGFFILQVAIPGFTELLVLTPAAFPEIWRFISAIFLHGGLGHLIFNIFALALFGTILERLVGGRNFLRVFFITGIMANIIAVNFYEASLGASGAIYGVLGALIVVRPMLIVFAFGIPMPLLVAGILWAAGDVLGLFVPSNVGNIAHLAGMFFGLIAGVFLRDWRRVHVPRNRTYIDESSIRRWEDKNLRR